MTFGNNEHVFNVGEAYKTMFKLTKKNGLIWIRQSVYNGNGFLILIKVFLRVWPLQIISLFCFLLILSN